MQREPLVAHIALLHYKLALLSGQPEEEAHNKAVQMTKTLIVDKSGLDIETLEKNAEPYLSEVLEHVEQLIRTEQ